MTTPLHWLTLCTDPARLKAWSLEPLAPDETGRLAPDETGRLAPDEAGRLAGMRFKARRRSFLLGRLAAKALLAAAEPSLRGVSPSHLSICNEPDGAPYVTVAGAGRMPGCLSISHRDDHVACAWLADPDALLGIDLERVEPRHPAFMEDYLTTGEIAFAETLPEPLRPAWVTLAWSAREAALKALGSGLRLDTRRLVVSLPDPATLASTDAWQPLTVTVRADATAVLPGWWQRRKDFVLTMVITGDADEFTLVEHVSL